MQKPAATGLVPPDASGGPGGGVRRTRGVNKAPAWRWDGPVSVIRLPLAVDEQAATRLESLFFAMFCLKRTMQREARSRTEAFWAGARRREADAAAWRREVGLTRPDLARAAYAHLDASGWLRHHATKALALHQADEVWTGVERHLFPDASGKRAGRPRTGSWWEYTRIPGRARSHTAARKVDGPVLADQITLTDLERAAVERERRTARRRARSLERSRRANNKARYELSRRQRGRQERRQAAGLPERQVGLPKGPRLADAAGRPLTSHRKDRLTGGYRALRTRTRVRQAGRTQAKHARAQAVAERITAAHGGAADRRGRAGQLLVPAVGTGVRGVHSRHAQGGAVRRMLGCGWPAGEGVNVHHRLVSALPVRTEDAQEPR